MNKIHVHKFGSELLTNSVGVDEEAIYEYARGLTETYGDDQLIVVTSGAVAAGRQLAIHSRGEDHAAQLSTQQHAAIGQSAIFRVWERAFAAQRMLAASAAITHRQLAGAIPLEKKVFDKFIYDNGMAGIVTNVNEADALSVKELILLRTGGENDGLASHMAREYGAYSLYLWKAEGGLFDDDNQLIETVDADNIESVKVMAGNRSKSQKGRGGIAAGVDAAWKAASEGVSHVQIGAVTPDMHGKLVTQFVVG